MRACLAAFGVLQAIPQDIVFEPQQFFELFPASGLQFLLVALYEGGKQDIEFLHAPPAQPLEFTDALLTSHTLCGRALLRSRAAPSAFS